MTIIKSPENIRFLQQPEHCPPTFVELGHKCMAEADSLKFTDSVQSKQLYQYASTYYQKAAADISDHVTKMSLVYLGDTARKNADLIEQYTTIIGGDVATAHQVPMPSFLKFTEVDGGRFASGGSRGKLSGVKNVPRALPSPDDGFEDLLILESKLGDIGLMPPSALLHEESGGKTALNSSTARLDFLSSSLGESFLFLSKDRTTGGLDSRNYFPSTTSTSISVHGDTPLPYGASASKGSKLTATKTTGTGLPPSSAYGSGGALKAARSDGNRPYGSAPSNGVGTGIAYWGATAGGLFAAFAPSVLTAQSRGNEVGAGGLGDEGWVSAEDMDDVRVNDINWNADASMMITSGLLPGGEERRLPQGSGDDAEGILKLLDTIDRLRSENNRLENTVDSLRMEKRRSEALLQQVEAFKVEYKHRISTYKKRLKKAAAAAASSVEASDAIGSSEIREDSKGVSVSGNVGSNGSGVDVKKMNELERTINGLIGKIKELKKDNELKDDMLRRYKSAAVSTGSSNGSSSTNQFMGEGMQKDKHHISARREKSSGLPPTPPLPGSASVSKPTSALHVDPVSYRTSSPSSQYTSQPQPQGAAQYQQQNPQQGGGIHGENRPSPRGAPNPALNRTRRTAAASPATSTLQTKLKREMSGSGYLLPGSSVPGGGGGAASSGNAGGKQR